jgi:molybdopterin converting factor small subunit
MSPTVTVRFTGELRSLAGLASLQLSLEAGATLKDAVVAAGELVSPAFADQVVGPLLEGKPAVPLLLLNRALCSGAELDQPVGEGDIVAFVLPMEGG